MADIVTNRGFIQLLANSFLSGSEYEGVFAYMAVGIGSSTPTANSTALSEECNPATHSDYTRVETTVTYQPEYNRILVEGIFDEGNITNSATIKEVGLVDTDDLEDGGNFYCVCQIPDMPKTNGIQLKIVITIGLEQIIEE
jgi:hypothetical protein